MQSSFNSNFTTMFHISKRARVGEASGDEGVVDEVNAVPKDISKTASEGPTQVKLQAYPMTKAGADSSKIGLMALHGWSILKPATQPFASRAVTSVSVG